MRNFAGVSQVAAFRPPSRLVFLIAGAALLASVSARAQTIGLSARQMAPRTWNWNVYYQGTEGQNLNFSPTSGPCAGGGAFNPAFPCSSSANVPATGDGNAIIMQVTYQPWENFQYYLGVGVGNFTLNLSSLAVTNVATGDRPGYLYHAGVRSVLVPDTIVGPAIALDGRIGWQRYYFNQVNPFTSNAGQINQRLDMYQYQVALEASHRFTFTPSGVTGGPSESAGEAKEGGGSADGGVQLPFVSSKWSVEPYLGLKWLRTQSYLKDLQGGSRIGGIQDTFTPFVGLVIPVAQHESLTSEASFVNGIQYSAGLQVRF